ncbi:MAG: pilus assembly protein PilP [bacterium]|nr:pilus assembly protein PilP [bacterium]MDT8394966.1 pilus assembly protein PilP [bacterium]
MTIPTRLTAILLLVLGVGLFAAPACRKAPPPPPKQAPVAVKPQQAAPPKAEAVAEAGEVEVFRYNPAGYRSPFGSLLRVKQAEEGAPEESLTPLQRIPVTDIRVEGIILMGKRSVANVITPDGKVHIVSVGTPMGRHKGKIVRLTSTEVIVEEQFEDYLGKEFKQETVLRLREKEGESL